MTEASSTEDLKSAINRTLAMIDEQRPDLAEQQALEVLKIYPDEVNSLRALGKSQRLQKKLSDAIKNLLTAVAKAPDFALAQQELGLCYFQQGETKLALKHLQTSVDLDPSLSASWGAMGSIYSDIGQSDLAKQAFDEQLKHNNSDPEFKQAVQLLQRGKIARAEQLCRNYLTRQPKDVSAIRLLADIAIKLKIYQDAEALLERCLELAPDFHLARLSYANTLYHRQKPEQALQQLDILEKHQPDDFAQRVLKAAILAQVGDFDNAINIYQQLLKQNPKAEIALSYGHALKAVGKQEQAIMAYQQATELNPNLGEAYWSLANLKTFQFTDEHISAMKKPVINKQVNREDFFHLCFALGKALEDRKDYQSSFHYYSLGNKIKKQQEAYSAKANHSEIQRTIQACPANLFSDSSIGSQDASPIFIVGLPRSGSTLLEQIIASHSQVDGTKELPDIIALARRLGGKQKKNDHSNYPEVLQQLSPEQRQSLGEEYLQRAKIQRGKAPFFIDKMPNNFAHIGLIQLILPQAKIIDARRHPMAACFGGFKQLFASGQRFSYDLQDIGHYYQDYVKLMNHWQQVMPGKILQVNYEEVVADTETQVRRILDFLKLPFEQNCVNFHQTDRAIRTASSEQVRQPIYTSAIDLWKHYEPYLEELKQALGPRLSQNEY